MLGGELQRVDDADHLVEVAAGGHRVDKDHLDLLVRSDHEHVSHRLVVGSGPPFARTLERRREHAPRLRDAEVGIANHRVVRRVALRLVDVVGPLRVIGDRVHAQADDLHVALVELGLDPGHVAKFSRAHRCEILRVREQDRP